MGKTSRRGELEDREAEEEDSGTWVRGKMGQISALSFIIIPENYLQFFFLSFTLKFLPLLMIVKFFSTSSHPKLQFEWPEVSKSSRGPFVCHHYLVFEEDTKVTYRNT